MKTFLLLFSLLLTIAAYSQTPVVIPIGSSPNGFGSERNNSALWYDNDLHTVSFFHLSNGGGYSTVIYDYSTDSGYNWPLNQINRLLFDSLVQSSRYVNGCIYNPPGNTAPSNAFETVFGPVGGIATLTAIYEGTVPVGGPTRQQTVYDCIINNRQFIPEGFQIIKNTGVTWGSAAKYNGCPVSVGTGFFTDTIILSKGIYNNATHGFDYTFSYVPLNLTYNVAHSKYIYAGHNMAWSDDGQTGYLAVKGNDGVSYLSDTAIYLVIYKTTDGGTTWNHLPNTPNIQLLTSTLNIFANTPLTSDYEIDAVVDKNNNLHCIMKLNPDLGNGTVDVTSTHWGLFDFYTTDGGISWCGKLLGMPDNFDGQFGTGTDSMIQRSRLNATRSWDGSKLFFSWFDTDSNAWGVTGNHNLFPDWFAVGYDVDLNMWTPIFDFTQGSDADAICNFATVSYYSINNGIDECLPMAYLKFSATPIDPVSFFYVGGACISPPDYTIAGNCISLNTVGIDKMSSNSFLVSSNYPNPFSGTTNVDVTFAKSADVTIEMSNMVGEVLAEKTYKNLHAGKNQLTIESANFAPGVYTYKVIAGNEIIVRKMILK